MKDIKIESLLSTGIVKRIENLLAFRYRDEFIEYKNKKKIIHILTPIHGNMGDHAIIYATNKYLKDNFKDYEILEVYRKDIYKYTKAIKKVINKDDVIVLIGGGNMGNLWLDEEKDRRFIIKSFPKNKIISMPQTISFTEDNNGRKQFELTKKIYNQHKDLTVIAREKKSYEIMIKAFYNSNVIINPDTVLYLNDMYNANEKDRTLIMTCLRNDKEGVLGEKKYELIDNLNKTYKNVFHYDTVIDKIVTKQTRETELENMLEKFQKSQIVITDRLHGMVFAAITKTPCIVTKSLDHKVTGTYEWIKELNYIRLVDNLEYNKIKNIIEELIQFREVNEINFNESYFNKLIENFLN